MNKQLFNCILIIFIGIPMSIMTTGWAISMFFNWFIAPFGVNEITMAHGLGFACLAGMFKIELAREKHENNNMSDIVHRQFGSILSIIALVGIGWICHNYI